MPVEENDAVDQAIRVLHLFDRFFALFLGELLETPVIEKTIMQPILVDGAQFELQCLVETGDDVFVALHGAAPSRMSVSPNAPVLEIQKHSKVDN